VSKLLSRRVLVPTVIIIAALVIINVVFKIPGVVLPEISIAAEPVIDFDLFGFWPDGITNTLLSSWLTTIFLVVTCWAITRKMKETPGRWQGALEMVIEGFYNLVEGAAGRKWARRFFPVVMTIFLFVIASNWLGLTPLFGGWGALHHADHGQQVEWLNESESVGVWVKAESGHEEGEQGAAQEGTHGEGEELYALAPMFRAATTDLNVTFALAIISVLMTQYFGVSALGIGYFSKFINVGGIAKAFTRKGVGCVGRIAAFGMGFIDFFIGIVESISEVGKVVSFSFRLFGNIFAGEVLLGVMAFLIPYLISLPFYGLELFVGFVQAMVFMMLSVAFFVVATTGHGGEGH
jgi:F-type H+-transporting ATPase subunit a